MDLNLEITKPQEAFINAKEDEVLYGGAAGGGKSYGQLIDALLYALKYKSSRQLILRRTFPELDRSLIITSLDLYPQSVAKYNQSKHIWQFNNKSIIEFGYCDNEADVTKYQSAEYDVIRFDELTHFTEYQYTYLLSRLRGANNNPKQVKSTTNPGGVGHVWVKGRFIDNHIPKQTFKIGNNTGVFIPAKVQDNKFLMEADPEYIKRLEQLPEADKKALLEGNWDIFEGIYFTEYNRDIHVIEPFIIPDHWHRFTAKDYGLDMLAQLWFTIDTYNNVYAYKELHESDLIVSEAARRIKEVNGDDKILAKYAPPDLDNRQKDTGKSIFDIFREHGEYLIKADNRRVDGWMAVKEWIKPYETRDIVTGQPVITSRLKIFSNCVNLTRCLPQVQRDEKNPNDVATEPHELTHIVDALRYFCIMRQRPSAEPKKLQDDFFNRGDRRDVNITGGEPDMSYINYGA
ncbi:terminase-like family protein [Oxobacter pfennigii]|uniref:Terminase-like family protein n=1 Tax=Oxobacter pfennigii TaxID=36849 RepID=A0A0P8Y8H6_9CLOT|nr:phage terminase large subunit [Oxobacter pfennigii]KPU43023.1 terminase-like family protein [Oxobacter pfennigii]